MEAPYVDAYAKLYNEHWWWRVREEIVTERIRHLLNAKGPRPRILDVGCGAGLFFKVLDRFGEVEGIESDRAAIEASGRWKHQITLGELDRSYNPATPFDLILMLDVLEHVPSPDRVLRRATEILAPDGWIVITVPAFRWLWTTHDELNHHLRRYSAKQLREEITHAGLEASNVQYVFQSLVVAKLLIRVREAVAVRAPRVPRIPLPAVNAALTRWYRIEHAFLRSLPFGSSVLAVATHGFHATP